MVHARPFSIPLLDTSHTMKGIMHCDSRTMELRPDGTSHGLEPTPSMDHGINHSQTKAKTRDTTRQETRQDKRYDKTRDTDE